MPRGPDIFIPRVPTPCWRWENPHYGKYCSMLQANQLIGFGAGGSAAVKTAVDRTAGTAIGNMTNASYGGLAASFDGTTSQGWNSCSVNLANTANIGKNWGSGNDKTICQYKVYLPNDAAMDSSAPDNHTISVLDLHGSTDNFSSSDVTLSTPSDKTESTTGMSFTIEQSEITTTTAFQYHKVFIAHNGAAATAIAEIEFWELA